MSQFASAQAVFLSGVPATSPKEFSVDGLAPLRFEGKAYYDAPPEKLFAMVSEPGNLHKWLPMIKTVSMDHSRSEQAEQCGVGSVRQCSFTGMGEVEESIVWWNPAHGYAFRFSPKGRMKMMTPTKDHVVVFLVEADGKGGSIFIFRNHFNWRGMFMRHMAAHMMPMMLNMGLANLRRELGGKGGKMRRIA